MAKKKKKKVDAPLSEKEKRKQKIQEYNDKVAKMNGEKTSKEKAKEKKENNILSAFDDGYNFGDVTRTINKAFEKGVDKAYEMADEFKKDKNKTSEKVKYLGEGLKTGTVNAATNFVDAPLQNIQEGAQKSKNKSGLRNYGEATLKNLDPTGLSTFLDPQNVSEVYQLWTDSKKSVTDKILGTGMKVLNNNPLTRGLEATGQSANTFRDAEEDVKNIRKAIRKPSEKLNKEYEKKGQKFTQGMREIGEASQNIGQQVPTAALSILTKNSDIGLYAMGTSAKGGSTYEAEQRGADLSTANDIGLAKGLTEIGTEKISSLGSKWYGQGKGDDLLESVIDNKVKGKVANYLTKKAAGVGGEILEEGISDVVGTEIDKATVDPDAKYTVKDFLHTAKITALSTIGMNAVTGNYSKKAYQKNALDMAESQRSENEQKVFEKELLDRLMEESDNGKNKLKGKDIIKITQEVAEDVANGQIDVSKIESALGGDTYKQYQDLQNKKSSLLKEQETLRNKSMNEATLGDSERLKQIESEISGLDDTELKERLSNEVRELTKDDNLLAKSYEEKDNRSKEFIYEGTDKDTDITKATIESTKGKLNNTKKAHNLVDALIKMGNDKGVTYKVTNNEELKKMGLVKEGQTTNGVYVGKDGEIYVNLDSKNYLEQIIMHETTHVLEKAKAYKDLQNLAFEFAKKNGTYEILEKEIQSNYDSKDWDSELTARIVEDNLGNEDFVTELTHQKPAIVQKIIDTIKYLKKQFTAGSSEVRKLNKIQYQLEQAYKKAYNEKSDINTNKNFSTEFENNNNLEYNESGDENVSRAREIDAGNNVLQYETNKEYAGYNSTDNRQENVERNKYVYSPKSQQDNNKSVRELFGTDAKTNENNKGKQLTDKQNKHFEESKIRNADGNLLIAYHGTKNTFDKFDKNKIGSNTHNKGLFGAGFYFTENEALASNYNWDENKSSDYKPMEVYLNIKNPFYWNNIRTEEDMNNLINELGLDENTLTWNRYAGEMHTLTETEQEEKFAKALQEHGYDGIVYKYDRGQTTSEIVAFEPNQIKSIYNENPTDDENIKYSVTDNKELDNSSFSLTEDSNGIKLTKQQQKYFKDSKVRDEKGRLLEVYHGTPNSDFNEFKKGGGEHGNGFYFTEDESYAEEFSDNDEGRLIKSYLKIDNPLSKDVDKNSSSMKKFVNEVSSKWDIPKEEILDIFNPYNEEWSSDLSSKVAEKMGYGIEDVENIVGFEVGDPEEFGITDYNAYLGSYAWDNGLNELARECGFDGIISRIYNSDANGYEYVAFNSNQIKEVNNTNPTDNPDIRYSLTKDNTGKELSKEQQEYFKGSKVVDKNGNLKVLYNGGGDYTTFDNTKMSDQSKWGKGIYLTENSEIANMYGDNVKEVYADIKNPINQNEKTISFDKYNKLIQELYDEEADRYEYDMYDNDLDLLWDATNKGNWADYGEQLRNIVGVDGLIIDDNNPAERMMIAFNSNQIKNVDNTNPTDDPDIRYSVSKDTGKLQENGKDVTLETSKTGTTGTLMAMHNLSEDKFNGIMDLGGAPVPSIAITNPNIVDHNQFGDGTLLFNKSTIDPAVKTNEVYDRDVWSPTFPRIEYDLDTKILKNIRNIVGGYGNNYLSSANSYLNNIEDKINNRGINEVIEDLKNNNDFKYVYYKNLNPEFEILTKQDTENLSTDYSNELLEEFINEYGKEIPNWGSIEYEQEKEIVNKFVNEKLLPHLEKRAKQIIAEEESKENPRQFVIGMAKASVDNIKEKSNALGWQDKLIENMNKIQNEGTSRTVNDYEATNEYINNNINQKDYEKWIDDTFKGLVSKKGIYNGKEYLTSQGNRRTFNQTHEEYNLKNLVKVLTKQNTVAGEQGFGSGQNFGTFQAKLSNKFNSIEDIKNAENRLQYNEETKNILDNYQEQVYKLMSEISDYNYDKGQSYYYIDSGGYALNDFAELKKHNIENLDKVLEDNNINSKAVPIKVKNDIIKVVNDLKNIPTDYFEAKPQRAVGLDEIQMAVIPNSWSVETKQKITDKGIPYTEYDPNIEGDRQRVINQFDDLKFSRSEDKNIAPVKKKGTLGSEVKLENGKVNLDNIAPVKGEVKYSTKEDKNSVKKTIKPSRKARKSYVSEKVEKAIINQAYKNMNVTTKTAQNYLKFTSEQKKEFKNSLIDLTTKMKDELTNAKTYNKVKDIVNNYANVEYNYVDEELKSIKKEIRGTKIKVPDEVKAQITDYSDFRKASRLNINSQGQSIDSVYQELSQEYPYLFSEDVQTEADMLYELSDFMYKDEKTTEKYRIPDNELKRATDKIYNSILNNSLTQAEIEEMQRDLDAKAERRTRQVVQHELLNKMGISIEDIDTGKDVSSAKVQLLDPKRLNEDVFSKEAAQKINDATVNFVNEQEAKNNRWKKKERQEIKDLGIKARSKESAAVQKYGEKEYVNDKGELVKYGDAELEREFSNPKTREKIKNAAKVLRDKYDNYIDKINESLTQMGYDPIPKRKDYFRHFYEINDKLSEWGIPFNRDSMNSDTLPTDINGLTDQFKPGKNFFASALQRTGKKTTYDAITGIDGYLESAGNLIHHTESIQRYRTLSKFIRDNYGSQHGMENLDGLTDEQIEKRISDIQNNKLSKYVAWLDEQANALAGKKGAIDRSMERFFGRRIYSALNTLKSQVGSNMTGFNVRSAMTNFASAVQGASKTNKLAFLKGTISTLNNIVHDDGLIDKSNFLTNRFGSDTLSKKAWQKVANAGQIFMTGSDYFTANQIWRSKYYENLSKGMNENQAIKNADDFASRIMGDRSKGQTAEIFNSKTLGFLTQFQLEVNNQWNSILHDNKIDLKNKNKSGAMVTFQLGQLFAASYMFNNLMKSLTGSDVMFDPIDILKGIFKPDDKDKDKTLEERSRDALGKLVNQLPMASIFTGGRIPLSEAFKGVSTGFKYATNQKNEYGQKYSLEDVKDDMIGSAAYWLLPTGYGQIKKTVKGLSMFDDKLPVKGSYTKSGNLRFSVDDTASERVKASLFGQYATKHAQDYIDSEFESINKSKLDEMKDLKMNSTDYKKLKKGINESGTSSEDKLNYIKDLDISNKKKNILASGVMKKDIDMKEYSKYDSLNEYKYAKENPSKYQTIRAITTYNNYKQIQKDLSEIKADVDRNGKTISNSRFKKVVNYVNSLKLTAVQKAMLIKQEYPSFKQYDNKIAQYINKQNYDFRQKATILKGLGFSNYDNQIINYVKEHYQSTDEQVQVLKDMGFKTYEYNGKIYIKR